MREILLVVEREVRERVWTRSFLLGTLLFPVFVLAIVLLPTMMGDAPSRELTLIDEAPAPIAQLFVASLNQANGAQPDPAAPTQRRRGTVRYHVAVVAGPERAIRSDLTARMDAEQLDGYVVLPADVRETGEVHFRSTRPSDPGVLRDIRMAATQAIQADRLARAGIDVGTVAELLRPVTVSTGRPDAPGLNVRSERSGFFFGYLVAVVIYFVVALYGSGVTRSVLEEKNNRIAEVLVSTMRATHLMAGKILGVTATVMLQLLVWAVVVTVLITQSGWISEQFSIDPAILNAIAAQPVATLALVAYFVLGFVLFASLFAALGATVSSDQEAQSFQMLFMLPLFVPVLFIVPLTSRPLDPLAWALGMIPFTAPVAMPMRMGAASIPARDVFLSLILLAVTCVLVAVLAGKIYRVGILSTGSRPGFRELLAWIRAG